MNGAFGSGKSPFVSFCHFSSLLYLNCNVLQEVAYAQRPKLWFGCGSKSELSNQYFKSQNNDTEKVSMFKINITEHFLIDLPWIKATV